MLYFTIQNRLQDGTSKVSEAAGARWRFCVRMCSDYRRIILESSFYWRKQFREFPLKSWASRFRGRRSIWWGWRVTLVAPRIGNDVSYVPQIAGDIDFAWQAQHLVRLDADCTFSAHWKWRFICDADRRWHWFCVAGAVFGEVGGWLFVTGAALRDILGDSRSANRCILQYKGVSKMGSRKVPEAAGARWRFYRRISSDYRRIIVGYPRIVFLLAEALQGVSDEILSFKISWQAQYLVRLEGDFTCSTHWKWGFICDADHWWHLFCVAGAVFGEVGGWLFVTGAALRDILGDSRDAKCCILQYKIVSKMGRVRSPKRRVRDDDFILGLSSDYPRISSNRLSIGGSIQGVSAEILSFKISW